MAGKRKKASEGQPDLAPVVKAAAAPTPAAPLEPAVVEYRPAGEEGVWRIEKWELFRAEFPSVDQKGLPEFHAFLKRHPRQWLIVRRLFGMCPLLVPLDGDPDDFRPWEKAELMEHLRISSADDLAAEFSAVRSIWDRLKASRPPIEDEDVGGRDGYARDLIEEDDEVLRRYHFPLDRFKNAEEKSFFANRIRECAKLFAVPLTSRLATQWLNNELRLRRAEEEHWDVEGQIAQESEEQKRAALENRLRNVQKRLKELEDTYQSQLTAIMEKAPWFSPTEKQEEAVFSLGACVKAIQEYHRFGTTKLADGIHTLYEILILGLRTTKQAPVPQYRADWVAYLNYANQYLWDTNWKPLVNQLFTPADLKRLQIAWRAAIQAYNEEADIRVPDMETGEEFDDLQIPDENEIPEQFKTPPEYAPADRQDAEAT